MGILGSKQEISKGKRPLIPKIFGRLRRRTTVVCIHPGRTRDLNLSRGSTKNLSLSPEGSTKSESELRGVNEKSESEPRGVNEKSESELGRVNEKSGCNEKSAS